MTELHICKYCGVETTQPDEECYAKPAKTITAVEFLVSQLKAKKWQDWNDLIQQALEMEKQQICKAFDEGWIYGDGYIIKPSKEYYSETYKKDNQ